MERLVRISFQLLGAATPPIEISRITGIIPDVQLLRGERNKLRDLPRQNIWALHSKSQSDEVAEHWHELEGSLDSARDAIKSISIGGKAKLTIVIESQHRLPSITIPSSMSEFAGFVGAVIDVDHLQS